MSQDTERKVVYKQIRTNIGMADASICECNYINFWPSTFLTWHTSGVASRNLTFPFPSLSFSSISVLRMCWRTTVTCVVYSDLKKLICQKNWINSCAFSSFDVAYHKRLSVISLNLYLAIKHRPLALWNTGLKNSIIDDSP